MLTEMRNLPRMRARDIAGEAIAYPEMTVKDAAPASPFASSLELKHALNAMVIAWRGGATVVDERLTILGTAKATVSGAVATIFATGDDGAPVVVTAVPVVTPRAAIDIARRLDSLEKKLGSRTSATPGRALVLCSEPPSQRTWRTLALELGPRLAGVYVKDRRAMEPLVPPEDLGERQRRLTRPREWSLADWLAAAALVAGVVLTAVGLRGMLG